MSWGKWIIAAFVLFGCFLATLVTVCMRQDISLVSKDYYEEELDYQAQISRMNNANQLAQRPVIHKSEGYLIVEFDQFNDISHGRLNLFSPSDPKKDKTYILTSTDVTQQTFPIADVARGMYRARMQWSMNGKEYYLETVIHI